MVSVTNDICPGFDDTIDTDGDGTPDGCDGCSTVGQACNDNDPCTTGDVYDAACNCVGTFQDSDNDGVCDANDICPGFDDTVDVDGDNIPDGCDNCTTVGQACNDNDPCTTGDVYDAACNCVGTYQDSDNDGVCDANDLCPGSDDNIDANTNGVPDACEGCPAMNLTGNVLGYDPGQDLGTWSVQDGGATLFMTGNSWKAVPIAYTVTANTVITFDFKSTTEGEIHEVSFDNDLTLSPDHRIVVYGNQGFAGNYTSVPTYTGNGSWQSYTIQLGNLFTGTYQYLVLTADDDGGGAGDSYFRNILIFEDPDGDLACEPSCGPSDPDSDNDGVCDAEDLCPGLNDALIGQSCSDGNDCTIGETYDATCNCSGGQYTDADGDGYCIGQDPDDSDACVPDASNCVGCQAYNFNDFENNWGIWNDGGQDAARSSNNYSAFANSGTGAVRIRDNSGSGSSIFTDNLDFSAFASIEVSFTYVPNSMENGEDFMLEVSTNGGSSFTTVQSWASGSDFSNDVRYFETVVISQSQLSSTTVIRLRCDASTNSDRVYLDDLEIQTCGSSLQDPDTPELNNREKGTATNELKLYPNPAYDALTLELSVNTDRLSKATIMTVMGEVVKVEDLDTTQVQLDLSDLDAATYFLLVETERGQRHLQKFIKL